MLQVSMPIPCRDQISIVGMAPKVTIFYGLKNLFPSNGLIINGILKIVFKL